MSLIKPAFFRAQMEYLTENLELLVKSASSAAYTFSAGLIACDWLNFLNQNAAACGVILGFMTLITNVIFQILNHRVLVRKADAFVPDLRHGHDEREIKTE